MQASNSCWALHETLLQAWAGFEVKHRGYAKAYDLLAQALASEQARGATDRQVSVLKAWGDAKVLQGSLQEAGTLYEQALAIQPDSLDIIVVRLLFTTMNSLSLWSIEDMTLCYFADCALYDLPAL